MARRPHVAFVDCFHVCYICRVLREPSLHALNTLNPANQGGLQHGQRQLEIPFGSNMLDAAFVYQQCHSIFQEESLEIRKRARQEVMSKHDRSELLCQLWNNCEAATATQGYVDLGFCSTKASCATHQVAAQDRLVSHGICHVNVYRE